MDWRTFFHALVFVSLLGAHVWISFERGPRDGVDSRWYINYALSVFNESRFPAGPVDIVPLHPLWLNMWMHIDPDYVDDLQCLRDNLPYWSGGKRFDYGDITVCRSLDNIGFYIQVLLGGIGTGLVWLAGWLASGRPMVAHLAALLVVYTQSFVIYGNRHIPEGLVIPLLAGVNVCFAWLVLGSGRAKLRTAAVAITCGLLLGALAITRPPYEFLLAALPFAAVIWMVWERPRRHEIVVATACILITASLVVAPWIVRNYTQKGFVGFTQTYGPGILLERLAFNAMTWRQWIASFPFWSGRVEGRLATELFGAETVAYLRYSHPKYYGYRARDDRKNMQASVATEDQLGFVLGRMWADLPKHLAVSVPLAWRGMRQHRRIPYGSACWLLVLFSFACGTHRNRGVLAALTFCPVIILAINALVSTSMPRYSIGLLTPMSVGVALPIAWVIDGVWNRLRRWTPWTGPRSPNQLTHSNDKAP